METRVNVPLRTGGKKMRKRKELDALGRRCPINKRTVVGEMSSQDQLLSESTDEPNEVWSPTKKERTDSSSRRRYLERRRACWSFLRACSLALVFACVVATTTVMWLFIDVREQAAFLRNELDQVVAGNQGVPDALQKCHSLSKELQQNQTALFLQLSELATKFSNFSSEVASVSNGLNRVEERFKTSPELINVPHDIQTLTTNVASFGSQMKDLASTVAQLKDANLHITEAAHVLNLNLTSLKERVSELPLLTPDKLESSIITDALRSSINSVQSNLSNINQTLSSKLQWTLEDQVKDHKAIVVLQDKSENVSARVTTLQNEQMECNAKVTQITTIQSSIQDLISQVAMIDSHYKNLLNQTSTLSNSYSKLERNNLLLQNAVKELEKSLSTTSSTVQESSTNTTNL
uniref:EF-hand domain-containing protein n=1 Tax=Clastoptera arizonana TaxID=38151 RepID=A0A1B6DNU3_9HEMI